MMSDEVPEITGFSAKRNSQVIVLPGAETRTEERYLDVPGS